MTAEPASLCPFCGSDDLRAEEFTSPNEDAAQLAVLCRGCGARGPSYGYTTNAKTARASAWRAWEMRVGVPRSGWLDALATLVLLLGALLCYIDMAGGTNGP